MLMQLAIVVKNNIVWHNCGHDVEYVYNCYILSNTQKHITRYKDLSMHNRLGPNHDKDIRNAFVPIAIYSYYNCYIR